MTTQIEVQNLKCGGCANTITKKINELKGIEQVEVDTESKVVTVTHDDNSSAEDIKQVLRKNGYPEVGEENNFIHKATSVFSCATGKLG